MRFVTDFLWRSPLGLRINAQDTAGVTQTEDWVRIRGDQLVPRDGRYDVRITAELWETHFFDHVSLLVVDHPDGTEVFVDERFSPASPPRAGGAGAARTPRAVARAGDDRGRDVTALVAARDGRYLATFARGTYQGIAAGAFRRDRSPAGSRADAAAVLVARGLDLSDRQQHQRRRSGREARRSRAGLSLEAQDADGLVAGRAADLGFPAGKNKTMLIDLAPARGARRLRLRTNLEIYWDRLSVARARRAVAAHRAAGRVARRAAVSRLLADVSPRGEAPETPDYARLANVAPRWRDLIGYHTRFGDVRELLDGRRRSVRDHERRRRTAAAVPRARPRRRAGWRRDFVLIGDGWEKDGDYNTGFSQTVLPLPSHEQPAYGGRPRRERSWSSRMIRSTRRIARTGSGFTRDT